VAREDTFGTFQIWEVPYPDGRTRRITNDLNAYAGVSLTADGRSLVTVLEERESHIWIARADDPSGAIRITGGSKRDDERLAWTPDGRIVHASSTSGNLDLWIMGADGSASSQLTFDTADDYQPTVCSDGRHVVFVSVRSGSHNLWRIDLDGGNAVQLTSGVGEFHPRCHPDGQRVQYIAQGPRLLGISEVSIDGGAPVSLTSEDTNAAWFALDISRDGSLLAYLVWDEPSRRFLLAVRRLADGHSEIRDLSFPFEYPVRWSTDGRSIHYVETKNDVDDLWSQPLDGGAPVRITGFRDGFIRDFAWSPDGSRLALTRGQMTRDVVLLERFR
jgi:Tol biopolymer transport system component